MIDLGFSDEEGGTIPSPVDPSDGISTSPSLEPTAIKPLKIDHSSEYSDIS